MTAPSPRRSRPPSVPPGTSSPDSGSPSAGSSSGRSSTSCSASDSRPRPTRSWLNGGSPTKGFLGNAVTGPFEGFYHSIAGAGWADVLFMAALLAVGTALILGIGLRVAAIAGGLLLVMMWTAVLPPETNPFMDDHLIYAGVLALLALTAAGNTLGFGKRWAQVPIVQRVPWLR